jgi:hypothetical protein
MSCDVHRIVQDESEPATTRARTQAIPFRCTRPPPPTTRSLLRHRAERQANSIIPPRPGPRRKISPRRTRRTRSLTQKIPARLRAQHTFFVRSLRALRVLRGKTFLWRAPPSASPSKPRTAGRSPPSKLHHPAAPGAPNKNSTTKTRRTQSLHEENPCAPSRATHCFSCFLFVLFVSSW